MDLLVCLKRVPIAGGTFLLTQDNRDVETKHLGFGISPHEENAVEAGVQLVEQMGGSLTLLTLGPTDAEEQLRSQLAIGASRAILLETDGQDWDPQAISLSARYSWAMVSASSAGNPAPLVGPIRSCNICPASQIMIKGVIANLT